MTTMQVERMVTVYSLDSDDLRYRDEIDANLFNVQLLRQLVDWAERDDKRLGFGSWNQGLWGKISDAQVDEPGYWFNFEWAGPLPERNVCGTAYCMAGQAAVQSDFRLIFDGDTSWGSADRAVRIEPTGEVDESGREIWQDAGGSMPISEAGRLALGIAECESGDLFNGDNTLDYIKARINGMCEDRGMSPLFPGFDATHYVLECWEDEE